MIVLGLIIMETSLVYKPQVLKTEILQLWHLSVKEKRMVLESTSENLSKENQNTNSREYKHPCVLCSIIYNCQGIHAAQMSISRWVDKTTMWHLHNGILLGHKKEENFILCDSMDGPGEHYAKWNKPVRERQIPYDFTHMWNLMNKLN